jgi:hypothetical protein
MTTSKIAAWRGGFDGFERWLIDTKPQVPSAKGGFETFVLGPREREELRKALDGDYRTIVLCWPRRHGKTLVAGLIIVWRFLTRQTQTIGLVANSEKQIEDTAFKLVASILRETPFTAKQIAAGAITLTAGRIVYEALGNIIQGYPASPPALYGKKLSVAQVSELHAAPNDATFQVLASSTIDSDDGLVLIDSTVGSRSSPLYALYALHEAGGDPSLFYSHISYRDLADACANGPAWIKPASLRSRAAQMLPAEFAAQHLNLWQSGSNALFPPAVIDLCRDAKYRLDVPSIAGGAAAVVGAGLDRAYAFSLHGDATVASCVVKVMINDEEHVYVLASDKITMSSAAGIKRAFQRYRKDHGLKRVAIESYNAQDIAAWCGDQDFDHEVISPTSERQANAFTALYNAAAEGRLHIHPTFERLITEMAALEYRLTPGQNGGAGLPKFEAARGSHDDHVYSLAWALFSLRDQELNPYELKGIHCYGAAPVVPLCVLNGGDLSPPCSNGCRSMREARSLYGQYSTRGHLNPISFADFAMTKIKNVGSHSIPR